MELDEKLPKTNVLKNLIPTSLVHGYSGGIIMRCALNLEMSGRITLLDLEEEKKHDDVLIPLAKNIDTLDIYLDALGRPTIGGQGEGVMCFAYNGEWHFSKIYGPVVWNNRNGVSLNWSYNSFARYTLETLSYLEGKHPKKNDQYFFGQIFDVITAKQ